jgi:hypothetical protein
MKTQEMLRHPKVNKIKKDIDFNYKNRHFSLSVFRF